MTDRSHPLVSLIVPVRNEEAQIEACLASIVAQDYPADRIECLVVDGESDDATLEITARVALTHRSIRVLANSRRSMPYALNIGIRHARGEFVGVVSGHSILPRDYISHCVAVIESHDAWAAGGRIVRVASTPLQRAIAVATSSRIGVGDSRHNYATDAGWVESVFPGFWRRDVFGRVGLFDPEMLVNEDNELSYRIRRAGGGIWMDPTITVEYVPRATLGALFRQYHDYARGKVRVWRKHRAGLRWRHFVPAAWVAFAVGGAPISALAPRLTVAWLSGIGAYGLVVLVAGLRLGRSEAPPTLVMRALVTLHAAYGLGFWRGLFEVLVAWSRIARLPRGRRASG